VNELLAKISSYNIFNYLVPGALFVIAAKRLAIANLDDSDLATKLLTYYIVGLVISRIGSLLIEPAMKWTNAVRYAPYKDFVLACSKDLKIEVLVEVSNTYRTLAAAFLFLLIGVLVTAGARDWRTASPWIAAVGSVLLAVMFLFSFSKQASYVRRRVEAHTGDK
jgi:xanthine/uracil permease